MSALDTAKEIVRIGSTAGLSKDVIDLMEKKLVLLTDELANAHRRIAQLEIENAQLKTQKPADLCPFCRRSTGQLQNMEPIPGLGVHGLKKGYFKCSNPDCGKTYDKQIKS
jgi:hypothetical protein